MAGRIGSLYLPGCLGALAWVGVLSHAAYASQIIAEVSPAAGGSLLFPEVPATSNDNYTSGQSNRVVRAHSVNTLDPVEFVYAVISTPVSGEQTGVTEYRFRVTITSTAQEPLLGMRFELGFSTANGFVESTLPSLDFDTPHRDTLLIGFPTAYVGDNPQVLPDVHDPTLMQWDPDASIWHSYTPGQSLSVQAQFYVDIPNVNLDIDALTGQTYIPTSALFTHTDGTPGYNLTLRMTPLTGPWPHTPEPTTLLAVLGLAVGVVRHRPARRR